MLDSEIFRVALSIAAELRQICDPFIINFVCKKQVSVRAIGVGHSINDTLYSLSLSLVGFRVLGVA